MAIHNLKRRVEHNGKSQFFLYSQLFSENEKTWPFSRFARKKVFFSSCVSTLSNQTQRHRCQKYAYTLTITILYRMKGALICLRWDQKGGFIGLSANKLTFELEIRSLVFPLQFFAFLFHLTHSSVKRLFRAFWVKQGCSINLIIMPTSKRMEWIDIDINFSVQICCCCRNIALGTI